MNTKKLHSEYHSSSSKTLNVHIEDVSYIIPKENLKKTKSVETYLNPLYYKHRAHQKIRKNIEN